MVLSSTDTMDYLIASSATSLGAVVGWMVHTTFVRQERLDAKVLGSIISVMVGAGVLGLFHTINGSGNNGSSGSSGLPREVYAYPIGLLVGVVANPIIKFIGDTETKEEQNSSEEMESAKLVLIHHIEGKGFSMMSFDKLRADLGKSKWTDEFFRAIIEKYPSELRNATLKGNRPGIAVVRK